MIAISLKNAWYAESGRVPRQVKPGETIDIKSSALFLDLMFSGKFAPFGYGDKVRCEALKAFNISHSKYGSFHADRADILTLPSEVALELVLSHYVEPVDRDLWRPSSKVEESVVRRPYEETIP